MHLHLLKVRSGRSTKRYARLVQGYRCDDGMPTQRVIANLGELSDIEVESIGNALKASPAAKSVVLTEAATLRSKVLANLDYLSIAVALEMWRSWNLSTMLTELISERDAAMCAADVICALTIQRCICSGIEVPGATVVSSHRASRATRRSTRALPAHPNTPRPRQTRRHRC